jgi:hypothetical protein
MFDLHQYLSCSQQQLIHPLKPIQVKVCDSNWIWKHEKKMVFPPVEPQQMVNDIRNKVSNHISFLRQQNSFNYGGYSTPSSIEDANKRSNQINEEEKDLQKKMNEMIDEYAKLYPLKKEVFLYILDLRDSKISNNISVIKNDPLDKLCEACNDYVKQKEKIIDLVKEFEMYDRYERYKNIQPLCEY